MKAAPQIGPALRSSGAKKPRSADHSAGCSASDLDAGIAPDGLTQAESDVMRSLLATGGHTV